MLTDADRFQPVTVAPAVYSGIQRAKERTRYDKDPDVLIAILTELQEQAALNWIADHRALFRLGLRVGFRVSESELETDGLR